MDATFSLRGGPELAKLLEAMPDRLMNNVMRGAMLAGAGVIRNRARQLAPLGHEPLPKRKGVKEKPGTLRKSIVSRRARGTRDTVGAQVGLTKAGFYGRFVEFGTAASAGRTTKKTGRHYRAHHATAAHPFMRPAADEAAGAAAQAVVDYASKRVETALSAASSIQAAVGVFDGD